MAKNFRKSGGKVPANTTKAAEQTAASLIFNQLMLNNVDRTPKDVGSWRDAHKQAESIHFPNRTRLYDLYADVILDGHLSGLMMKRVESVLNKKLRFVRDSKEVKDICKLIGTNEFRRAMKEVLLSIFWGVSGMEFIPGEKFDFKELPRKHIKPEKKILANHQTDYEGIPYEDISNVWVIGEERDLGLLLKCAFYVLLKKGTFSDWANYIEIFGQPLIVTKYDTYDQKTKDQLAKFMAELGASLRLSIPKQADFEVVDGKTSNGNGDLQNQFKDACNDELSVLVLGNTETTKSSKSSGYAQSKEHGKQQLEITKSDIQLVCNYLNSDKFRSILKSYGYEVEGGEFVIEEQMSFEDQKSRSEVLKTLKNDLNLPLSDDQLYEEFGVIKPADYDTQKQQQASQTTGPDDEPEDPAPGNNKPKDKGNPRLTWKEQLLSNMADFFARARKD